jgi:hypothetical protein
LALEADMCKNAIVLIRNALSLACVLCARRIFVAIVQLKYSTSTKKKKEMRTKMCIERTQTQILEVGGKLGQSTNRQSLIRNTWNDRIMRVRHYSSTLVRLYHHHVAEDCHSDRQLLWANISVIFPTPLSLCHLLRSTLNRCEHSHIHIHN